MTNTTTSAPELAERVPYSVITRLVAEADPALIEAMERAAEEFHRHEESWQADAARHQRNAGMQSVESPFGKALREASTAVVEKSKELLAAGALRGPGRPTGTG